MNRIQILDCTLRDGGYINDFEFGRLGIKKIIAQLTRSNIDIIECGFLEDGNDDPDLSLYSTVDQIAEHLPQDHGCSMYVAMACYGEYDISQLKPYDGKSIDGIRVTFHYNEVDEAIEYCRQIKDKGYKVFVQPVGTTSYSDEQLMALIHQVNGLQPYSFYLVDTLGLMHKQDVLRFFYLIDHNLDKNIHIGFHSHNNLQLSYSNCQALVGVVTSRVISLDASVYGMGRGAGNLNTELIANYINDHISRRYNIEPLLEVIDEYILNIKAEHDWGYSVPYYLAAINGCHPNYASYLSGKQTLTIQSIGAILRMIEPEKRSLFDKKIAEEKYLEYQSNEIDDTQAIAQLKDQVKGRKVMLIAPGPSLNDNVEKLLDVVKREECLVISATFVPNFLETDFVFLSNLKRYNTTFNTDKRKVNLICTSNISIDEPNLYVVNYSSLLNEEDAIRDNTSVMLINLLKRLEVSTIFVAGMDGYRANQDNYYLESLKFVQDVEHYKILNDAMTAKMKSLRQNMDIRFVTPSLYD